MIIRTKGGILTINAEEDEVIHYGQSDYVDIIAVKPSSYKENGKASLIKVAKGNVALTSESKVGEIHLAKTGDAFTEIKVTLENGAKLPDLSRDPVGTNLESPMFVCEVVESGASAFYWLSGNATMDDHMVLVSETKTGEKVAASDANLTAVAIANVKVGEETTDSGKEIKAASQMTYEELVDATSSGAAKSFAEIGSKEEFLAFRDAWNGGRIAEGGTFKLTSDIDLSDDDWIPIGALTVIVYSLAHTEPSITKAFKGTFDGNNHTVKIALNSDEQLEKFALFNAIGGSSEKYSVIKDLTIGVDINAASLKYAGGLTSAMDWTRVENVTVNGVIRSNGDVGCFAAYYAGNGSAVEFVNCTNNANIYVTASIGRNNNTYAQISSFASQCEGTVSFTNCVNNGSITYEFTGDREAAFNTLIGNFIGQAHLTYTYTFTNCSIGNNANIIGYSTKIVNNEVIAKSPAGFEGFNSFNEQNTYDANGPVINKLYIGQLNGGCTVIIDGNTYKSSNWN